MFFYCFMYILLSFVLMYNNLITIGNMRTYKTEEYYYLRAGLAPSAKYTSSVGSYVERVGDIKFEYPSYLTITSMERQSKENHLFQDTHGAPSQFYQVSLKKSLLSTQLQNHLTLSFMTLSGLDQKTEATFKIQLSDIIKGTSNKDIFTEKHVINSVDSACKMELIIVPSYNQLTTEILDKIISHEDSKLTVDTSSRLENLPTQQSLGYQQRKNKFKRTGKQYQLKLQKKAKSPETNSQVRLIKGSKPKQLSPVYAYKDQSPVKRSMRMRRSQLIPQDFHCQMQQIDEHQTLQYYRKNASNIAYILALLLQIIIIIKLMTPSSKL